MALPPAKSVDVLEKWVKGGWCDHFAWTLKFVGSSDYVAVLARVRGVLRDLPFSIRHLPSYPFVNFVCQFFLLILLLISLLIFLLISLLISFSLTYYKHGNEVVVMGCTSAFLLGKDKNKQVCRREEEEGGGRERGRRRREEEEKEKEEEKEGRRGERGERRGERGEKKSRERERGEAKAGGDESRGVR